MEPLPTLATDRNDPWDGYLVGPENALAHAAARELARGGEGTSPLVIVGPSGSGKSRLLSGIAGDRIARRPGAAIALIGAESFAASCNAAAGAAEAGPWAEIRERFRAVELLAIDDLHGLSRSPLALEELAPTLDALDDLGAAVAVATRDVPDRFEGWPRRLADRFRGGLTVRLDAPGPPSRRRYLLERARARGLSLSSEAVDALAENADGYRSLDGLLARLTLAGRVERRPLDLRLARSLLEQDAGPPSATVAEVARAVARQFGLRLRDLRSPDRRAALVEPRHLAILLARELTGASYTRLGAAFGNRDTKTIRHACRAADARLAADPALAAVAESIRRRWARSADGNAAERPS